MQDPPPCPSCGAQTESWKGLRGHLNSHFEQDQASQVYERLKDGDSEPLEGASDEGNEASSHTPDSLSSTGGESDGKPTEMDANPPDEPHENNEDTDDTPSEPSETNVDTLEHPGEETVVAGDGGSDTVSVNHEGSQKLSPAGFEDGSVSAIDPPEGVELPEDASPDDFEPGEAPAPPEPSDTEGSEGDSSGGILSRIKGDQDTREVDEIVEAAPDEEERKRREQLRESLDQATHPSPSEGAPEGGSEAPSTGNQLVVDEDLVATMFSLPFSQAATVTGWDGWEVSEQEAQANAELIVAYCEEQNIDLSTGTMLGMSLFSTVGGRIVGYQQYRKGKTPDASEPSTPPTDDVEEAPPEPVEGASTEPPTTPGEPTADGGETFDFEDPRTW